MAESQDIASAHHFDMHASIVLQLGDDLITDVIQAIIELVKNCYDADATYANVVVESSKANQEPDTFFPGANGFITIEDNGVGMDEGAIQRGWLTISNSMKREMKRAKRVTPEKKRTPLGDKGLGRLGAQKLGFNIELFTKPKNEDFEYHVGWSWRLFAGDSALSEIRPHFVKTPSKAKRGTRLLISDIRDTSYWTDQNRFFDFQRKLSQLVSPYTNFRDFTISAAVDGRDVELAEISDRIRKLAHLRYKIDFENETFNIGGKAALGFIRPKSDSETISAFESLVESDDGERFFEFLQAQPIASQFRLRRSRSAAWFVEFSQCVAFPDIPGLRWIDTVPPSESKVPANPGPFHSEIDAFDLSLQMADSSKSAFDTLATYRAYIKDLNGVRIFRDGFGVRVDKDWLGLASQWTGAQSYYALKPDNTLGFVALTARDNADLVETTDREGFKDTPHFENFMVLFGRVVKFAHDVQEFLRRGWLDYLKSHQRELAEVAPSQTPEQLRRQLSEGLSRARKLQTPVADAASALAAAEASATVALDQARAQATASQQSRELVLLAENLSHKLSMAQHLLSQVTGYLDEVMRLRELAVVLEQDAQSVKTQLEEAYEMVSLGLTAEALSHEVRHIADSIARRTQDVARHIERSGLQDTKVIGFVEFIRSSIAALRKQMEHLSPSLKYVREKREQISVANFLVGIKEFFDSRWEEFNIVLDIRMKSEDFTLNINRGKLTQVVDNLALNSEYWVREELKTGRIKSGKVTIEVDKPFIRIWDNGPGIDPVVESSLFEPFVSRKPRLKGRGLGLFIVRQLLDTEGCVITLSSRRNDRNRLYRFEIDLSGAIHE